MNERFEYAKNGICRFENFAEHLAADDFSRIYLGNLCGMKWYSQLRISGDGKKVFPVIYCDNDDPEVEHSVQIYLKLENHSKKNIKNLKKIKKEVLQFDKVSRGFDTPILEILDLKNGWLDDGALSFEYGVQVIAIAENKIWKFNFIDKLFNAGAEQVQFDRVDDPNTVGPLYAHKLVSVWKLFFYIFPFLFLLLSFHSTNLEAYFELGGTDERLRSRLVDFFQVCHGVRLNLEKKFETSQILRDAFDLKTFNVVSYCDWYFIQIKSWERLKGHENAWILFAIKYNMRHFLVFILKSMTSLKEFVSEENVEKMSNESMKMFVAKFLYEKF